MKKYRIEIGAADDVRHVGIEPPIGEEDQQTINVLLCKHYVGADPVKAFGDVHPEYGPVHTLISLRADREFYYTPTAADEDILRLARKIGRLLGEQAEVAINETIKPMQPDCYLFEGRVDTETTPY